METYVNSGYTQALRRRRAFSCKIRVQKWRILQIAGRVLTLPLHLSENFANCALKRKTLESAIDVKFEFAILQIDRRYSNAHCIRES